MCRALTVVTAAADRDSLLALKAAASGAGWELAPGATAADQAVAQIAQRGAHVLVVWGGVDDLVARARGAWPDLRIIQVTTGPADPRASAIVGSLEAVREAILGPPPPGGPVRS